jgi:CheY-like chemotaxis protein
MAGVLESKGLVVGKTRDPIDFISNSLILNPRVIFIDVMMEGDISSPEVIKSLRGFNRLRDAKILVFTQFLPENIDSIEGIEQLREAKNRCLEAGAYKYIGRYTSATFWDMVEDFFA